MEMDWASALHSESTGAGGQPVAAQSLGASRRLPGGGVASDILKFNKKLAIWTRSWEQWRQNRIIKLVWTSGAVGAGNVARGMSGEVCLDRESLVQKGDFVQQAMDTGARFCAVEEAKRMLVGMLAGSRWREAWG